MIEVIAAAIAAVKLGSAVIAAVAALISAREGCAADGGFGCENCAPSKSEDI